MSNDNELIVSVSRGDEIPKKNYETKLHPTYELTLRLHEGQVWSKPHEPFDDYKKTDATEFPFRTTLHALNSAIIKLSRTQRSERVFRGAVQAVYYPQSFGSLTSRMYVAALNWHLCPPPQIATLL